jgi:hypothetical protein
MEPETVMKQLYPVLRAAREAGYHRAEFVSSRMEIIERPVLGRIERQNSTAAVAWLNTPPKGGPETSSPASTMDLGDYTNNGDFVRELVKRRQTGKRVVLRLP